MADWLSMVCLNLREMLPADATYYMTKQKAITELRSFSGEDFGEDVERWLAWVEEYRQAIRSKHEQDILRERHDSDSEFGSDS